MRDIKVIYQDILPQIKKNIASFYRISTSIAQRFTNSNFLSNATKCNNLPLDKRQDFVYLFLSKYA